MRFVLDRVVSLHDTRAERRQLGAAAALAAMLGRDHRLIEQGVQRIDQQPGTAFQPLPEGVNLKT